MREFQKKSESLKSEASAEMASPMRGKSEGGRKRIAIVGVGLIGGSLAIQLHEKKISSRLIGVDSNEDHSKQAVELELVDEVMSLNDAIAASDVIILAIPVDTLVDLLPSVLDRIDNQIVIDLGSTKSQSIEA